MRILMLTVILALAFCPRPPSGPLPPWLRPGYQEPRWASELRILLDVALRRRDALEGREAIRLP